MRTHVVYTVGNSEPTIIPFTPEEEAAEDARERTDQENAVREQRDRLLQSCDWTQLPDAPVDAQAWSIYRQELRDVTDQAGFPASVAWPVPPTN